MNLYNDALQEYGINDIEYAENADKPSLSPDTILMHIPKLMSLIPKGIPEKFPQSVSDGIYSNDSKCKITTTTMTTCQNYLTIDRHINQHPEFPDKDDGNGLIERFSTFYVEIMNKDIRDIHFTDRI